MEWSWRVKLANAEMHLAALEEACDRYLRETSAGFSYIKDRGEGTIEVLMENEHEPPLALGAMVGDVLQNLRSALDSIAWEAVQRAGTPPNETSIYFPITWRRQGRKDSWEANAATMLPNVSAEHLAHFESVQPWFWDEPLREAGHDIPADRAKTRPLYRLHELAKIDRHRTLHPVLANADELSWAGAPEGVRVRGERYRPDKWSPGTVICRWYIDPPESVDLVEPSERVILTLDKHESSVASLLTSLVGAVTLALRRIEIDVLRLVTQDQLEELAGLGRKAHAADEALAAFHRREPKTYGPEGLAALHRLEDERTAAHARWHERSRELFL